MLDAAALLFSESGWAGFNIESVARLARVGKASIYLRWPTKEELLLEALSTRVHVPEDSDTGSLRSDLIALAHQLLPLYAGEQAKLGLRISLEVGAIPGLAEQFEATRKEQARAVRAIVQRGIARGELPASTSSVILINCLAGAVIMLALTTPVDRHEDIAAQFSAYADDVVELLLQGAATS